MFWVDNNIISTLYLCHNDLTMPIFRTEVRKTDMIHLKNGKYFAYEMIGEFRSSEEWIHPTRSIDSCELILVREGTVYIEEAEIKYTLKAGDIILLDANTIHGGWCKSGGKTSFYWFHFYTNLSFPFKVASSGDVYDIHHYIKKLLDATNGGYCSENTADALGFLIFDELFKAQNQLNSPVQRIKEYIRINRKKDISVLEIAEEFGYNPEYMGRLFKKQTNIGLKEYIASVRLSGAKELLVTTTYSVKEISKQLGWENENLFIKFFVYHEKITPTAYRNRYLHTHLNNK